MRSILPIALVFVAVLPAPAVAEPAPALPQRIVYVGNSKSNRAREFVSFLKEHFPSVQANDRDAFVPTNATGADVVILDWSQDDVRGDGRFEFPYPERRLKSPLGPREAWTRPTVLIGSAGHLLAACWQVHGGSG